jgi:EAL domain-containing protein (putative c-di-GMP-specific phosphodiesterase class I)
MYSAKASPDSNYRFYTDHMHQEATQRLQMEQDLLAALKAKQSLVIHYQPKLAMPSGKLVGAEALIRWEHPEKGLILPGAFLPLLPAAAIGAMDRWVLETVCQDMKRWESDGMKPLQVSIHISDHAWNSGQVIGGLLAVARASGLHKKQLAFEVEESAILQHGEDGLGVVSLVRESGLDVHLDNFGSNLSSLKLLTRYPLDAIKIDRSLTAGIDKEERNAVLVQALIALGQRLGIKTVAEGVETLSQEAALALMNCDQIQGRAIAGPLPAGDFARWVRERQQIAS